MSGFLLILFSELGDKTFFIAVLLALKYRSRQGLVFVGSFGALAVMTLISVPPSSHSLLHTSLLAAPAYTRSQVFLAC